MAGTVIRRLAARVEDDGSVYHDDAPATWAAAEAFAGRRLDRRRNYAIIEADGGNAELCESESWSTACSGCTETPEMTSAPERGMGRDECGYQGRRRQSMWVPTMLLGSRP